MGVPARILLAAMMVLIIAPPPSKACSPFEFHLQSFFCHKNIVMKGQFRNASETNNTITGYYIKVEEVFKGHVSQDVILVGNLQGTSCEYQHQQGFHQDLLIAIDSDNYVDGRSYIGPWEPKSISQINRFQVDYAKTCSCEVDPCFWTDCSTSQEQCVFHLYGQSENQEGSQICVRNEQGICTWETIEESL